jgi:hypothetical protein
VRRIAPLAAPLGVVASLITIGSASTHFWASLYPFPTVVGLAVLVSAAYTQLWLAKRKPSDADQQRLNRLLSALPREAIRGLASEDFSMPWRERNVYPVAWFVNELEGPEEHFSARRLERCRQRLYDAGSRFLHQEAYEGFAHESMNGFRNIGWSTGELEGASLDVLNRAEARSRAIRAAAADLLDAHERLVSVASKLGLCLDALASDAPRPPWQDDEVHESFALAG